MKTISYRFQKDIPVVADCDVLVVGGGLGGFAAAVMAARQGVATVLADRHGKLGGTAAFGEITPMMPNHYSPDGKNEHGSTLDRPVYCDLLRQMNQYQGEPRSRIDFTNRPFNCEEYTVSKDLISLAMEDLCLDAGVRLLYHFDLADVKKTDDRITYAIFLTKSGFVAIAAKQFVDATGDGDLAALAECPFEYGDANGNCQPMTLCFKLAGVEKSRIQFDDMQRRYKEAQAAGRIDCKREDILMFGYWVDDVLHFNTTRVLGFSAIDAVQRAEAEIEGRRQMRQIVNWLRAEVAGFEHARYYSVAAEVGVRESRRILGRAYLTEDDFVRRAKFPDAVVRSNYNIDIHSPTGSGTAFVRMSQNEFYEIPFGCLIPCGVNNLAVGGRSISVSHELHASSRIMPSVCSTGQAAGMGCAMAVKQNVDVAALDGVQVRRELVRQGANLD